MRRDEADWEALRRSLRDVGTNYAALMDSGEIWKWYGRSPAFPEPRTDGYFRDWSAEDLALRIRAARRAGTLRLDGLLQEGDETTGLLPLGTITESSGHWSIDSSTAAPLSIAEFRSLPQLPGVARIATVLDRQERRWLEKAFRKLSSAPMTPSMERFRASLNALAPQRVPTALLEGGNVHAAWILPSEMHTHNQSPIALKYQLFTIAHDGSIFLRPITDSNDCVVLPRAARIADCDHAMRSRDSTYLAGFLKPTTERRNYFAFWHLYDDPESTVHSEPSIAEHRLNAALEGIADQIFEQLSPSLRDAFEGVDDYNVLQARGDAKKAAARQQASATVFGGLGPSATTISLRPPFCRDQKEIVNRPTDSDAFKRGADRSLF